MSVRCRMRPIGTVLAASICAAAVGAPVAVVNHGFEADFAAPNSFPVLVPQGWILFDPSFIVDQSSDAVGVLNPTGGTFFPGGAPDGSNVALIYLAGDVGAGPVGLRQELADVLTADTRYTLTVEVGNIASGTGPGSSTTFYNLDGFPGYRIELRAGGEIIAQDENSLAPTIPEGEFRTSEITVDIGAAHDHLGEALEVRVINLNQPGTAEAPGIEVDFDNVRLDASPLAPPCPGNANGDNIVDFNDLAAVLGNWLADYTPATGEGDADGDGLVDFNDIASVLANWLSPCP